MMGRLLEKRWVCILLSILLAIVFWLYVRASVDPEQTTTIHNVRVEMRGTNVLTSQSLTVAGIAPEVVELQVRAPSSVLNNLIRNRSGLSVQIDVSSCTEGENTLRYRPVWPENFNNVEDVVVEGQEPASILVTVEKLYSKSFAVEFQLEGRVAKGYQMGTPAIEPETVMVSGPVEQVNRVAKVAAILQDGELDERFAGDLPLTALDSQGRPLADLEVTLSAETAYVVVPVVVTKSVELTVDVQDGGGAREEDAKVEVTPSQIVVSGSEVDLDGLDKISLGSVDLSNVVTSKTFTFPINLDPSLGNESGLAFAEVTVTVDGLDTEAFTVTNIRTTTVPDGYTVELVTQSVLVMVRGRTEDLAGIDASQLQVVADLSEGFTLGASRVPARVYLNGTDRAGVIGAYTVAVIVSE